MAEIPVEKKSSKSWLWILLAIIVIALLLWWAFAEADEEEYVADDAVVTEATDIEPDGDQLGGDLTTDGDAALAGGALTSLVMIADLDDPIGRQVDFDNVRVTEVVGDMGFTIGEGAEETLVTFNQTPTPDTPMEGQIDVNPGSMVDIEGAVQSYDANVSTSVSREIAENTEYFIDATDVNVVN